MATVGPSSTEETGGPSPSKGPSKKLKPPPPVKKKPPPVAKKPPAKVLRSSATSDSTLHSVPAGQLSPSANEGILPDPLLNEARETSQSSNESRSAQPRRSLSGKERGSSTVQAPSAGGSILRGRSSPAIIESIDAPTGPNDRSDFKPVTSPRLKKGTPDKVGNLPRASSRQQEERPKRSSRSNLVADETSEKNASNHPCNAAKRSSPNTSPCSEHVVEDEELGLAVVVGHHEPSTASGIYSVPPSRQSSCVSVVGSPPTTFDKSTGESIYSVPRGSPLREESLGDGDCLDKRTQESIYSVPRGSAPRRELFDDGCYGVAVKDAPVIPAHTRDSAALGGGSASSYAVPKLHPAPAVTGGENIYDLPSADDDDDEAPAMMEVAYATIGDPSVETPRNMAVPGGQSLPERTKRVTVPDQKPRAVPRKPARNLTTLPVKPVPYAMHKKKTKSDHPKVENVLSDPGKLTSGPLSTADAAAYSPQISHQSRSYTPGHHGSMQVEPAVKMSSSEGRKNDDDLYAEPTVMSEEVLRPDVDVHEQSHESYHRLVFRDSTVERDGNELASTATTETGSADPNLYHHLSVARDSVLSEKDTRFSHDVPNVKVEGLSAATTTSVEAGASKHKPSNPYETIWAAKSSEDAAVKSHGSSDTAYSYNHLGRHRSVPEFPGNTPVGEQNQAASTFTGQPEFVVGNDAVSNPYSYATVTLSKPKPVASNRMRSDTDDIEPPPLSPFAGSLPCGASLADDNHYSLADDPLAGNQLMTGLQGDKNGFNRRSCSLDSHLDRLAVDVGDSLASHEDLNDMRKKRLQRHTYEDIEIRPQSMFYDGVRTPTAEPSDVKWKEEADALRKQRLQRHNYELVEPKEKKPGSSESPGQVSEAKPAKDWRRPNVQHNYELMELKKGGTKASQKDLTVVMSNSISKEDLAWDDLEMQDPFVTQPATLNQGYENVLNFGDDGPSSPPTDQPPPLPLKTKNLASKSTKKVPGLLNAGRGTLPPGWEVVDDPEMGVYYYHAASGTTQWAMPDWLADEAGADPSAVSEAVPSSADNSESMLDSALNEIRQAAQSGSSNTRGTSSSDANRSLWRQESREGSLSDPLSPTDRLQAHTYAACAKGYIEVTEQQLTQQKNPGCVAFCIQRMQEVMELDSPPPAGFHMEEQEVFLKIHGDVIKVVDAASRKVLQNQSIQGIRMWGISKEDNKMFAYIARDMTTRKHRCHVFRCQISGRKIARILKSFSEQMIAERRAKQDNIEKPRTEEEPPPLPSKPKHPVVSSEGEKQEDEQPDGCESKKPSTQAGTSELDDPLLRDDTESFAATYFGLTDVPSAQGNEVVRNALSKLKQTNPNHWIEVVVEVAPNKVRIIDQKTQLTIKEHRIRFLTFLGFDTDPRYCGYIMSSSKEEFWCHGFMCEKTSGKLVLALQRACKLRFQRVLESQTDDSRAQELAARYGVSLADGRGSPAPAAQPPRPAKSTSPPARRSPASGRKSEKDQGGESKPVPESSVLSIFRLNRKSAKKSLADTNPYHMSVMVKYYGSEDVGSRSAGVDAITGPVERLTAEDETMLCLCDVDVNGITLSDSHKRRLLERHFPVSTITYVKHIAPAVCFIVDQNGKNICHVIGPEKPHMNIEAVAGTMEASLENYGAQVCGGTS